jgi:D-glycero-alpha-D-manno-heptose-7-phosphate kinase
VIISRTPLRISLGGGGTDLPGYYRERGGGHLVAAAISKYVYIAVNRNFDDDVLLKYSQVERCPKPEDVRHPILREALLVTRTGPGIEVSSMADIPAGTGLGSSGAFTVGVLRALAAHQRLLMSAEEVAALACHVELDRLGEPIGKQDQYIASYGGLTSFEFRADDSVSVRRLDVSDEVHDRIEENLLLFYTGLRRSASQELALTGVSVPVGDPDLSENLDAVRRAGHETARALEAGDLSAFGTQLTDQWKLKLRRAPSPLHQQIDRWIEAGLEAGALGGKLVGAGGGGFLLFYSDTKSSLREAMRDVGLEEVTFGIDSLGSTVIVA